MATDSKKAQTIRNLWYQRVASPILQADAVVAAIRAAIVGNNLAGSFSTAELNAMVAVESALNTLADLAGVTAAASKYVPTHRSEALTITGVNDG